MSITKTFSHCSLWMTLSVFILLSSCTTQFKKAQNLIEEKNYEQAMLILEELTQKNPQDPDYPVYLKKARNGVIDQRLIQVRLTRLANNKYESLELLRQAIEDQNRWSVFPTGAVAFTQSEEINEAYQILLTELKTNSKTKNSFRNLYFLERYRLLFTEERLTNFQNYKNEALKRGAQFCQSKSQSLNPQFSYTYEFYIKLCQIVNFKIKPLSKLKTDFKTELYKDLSLNQTQIHSNDFSLRASQLTQIISPSFFNTKMIENLNAAFKKTGWYEPRSQKNLQLNAQFNFNIYESLSFSTDVHHYKIKDPSSTTNPPNEITKSFVYPIKVTTQKLVSRFEVQDPQKRMSGFSDQVQKSKEKRQNDFYNSEIGLYPSAQGELFKEDEVLKFVLDQYNEQFLKYLRGQFRALYCDTLNESHEKSQTFNQALICLRQENPNDLINRLFNQEFQITATQMQTLLQF